MRRPAGVLILVALVAFGGLGVFWARREFATAGQRGNKTAQSIPDLPPPATSNPATSRPSASPLRPQAQGSLCVRLRCLGKPVADVEFTILEEATHQQEKFSTGPDGAHLIRGLPAGQYHLAIDHPDYVFTGASPVVEADKTQELAIELDPGGRLEGTVRDAQGRPLEGAQVYFLDPQNAAPVGHNLKTTTDATGHYQIVGIPVGTYDVRFIRKAYRSWRKPDFMVLTKGEHHRLDAILRDGRSITGRVLTTEGEPLAGAVVVGTNEENSTCRSDADGAFSLEGLGENPAACFASAAGYGATFLSSVPAGSTGVLIRLARAAEVSGRIESRPLPDEFTVQISRFEQDRGQYYPLYARAFQGSQGDDFSISEVPPGRYRLEVKAEGYETQVIPELEISAGQSLAGLQVRLRKKS
jgi:hypothetical protein